jgi:hypothetical protein
MGKASRIKAARRAAATRRLVVVDACEIGQRDGMLTLRVGKADAEPVCLAIPASAAVSLVANLRSASLDAEELYWEAIGPVARGTGSSDPAVVSAAVEAWLLGQDWAGVVRRVPAGDDEMFLVSHAGHVGLAIAPPFTDQRTLAIFDPIQLRRLAPGFQSALAAAGEGSRVPLTPDTVAAVVSWLQAMPWQAPPGFVEATPQEAEVEMLRRRREFLARQPFVRPDENQLPTDGD